VGDMADWVNERDEEYDEQFDESQEMIPFEVKRAEAETPKAWLLVVDGQKEWFPKSRCDFDSGTMILEVPRWLAMEKGLI
jgi:hypothetical protein